MLSIREGQERSRDDIIKRLVEIQYERNDMNFIRNKFRVRGDVLEVFPAGSTSDKAIRIEFFGDEIDRISEIDIVTGEVKRRFSHVAIFPASHYIVSKARLENSLTEIENEMEERVKFFTDNHKLIEAQRIEQRTRYDMEMLREIGTCKGVENYSRVLAGRAPGSSPITLMHHFPKDFLMFIDESHVTLPQVRGMYGGDFARKKNLVDYGFRLPSAYDNRPMNFDEFTSMINQVIYVSSTPGEYEKRQAVNTADLVIGSSGLLDPIIEIKPVAGQIEDLYSEINERTKKGECVLITTLTKKMAEDLTAYYEKLGVIIIYLRMHVFDVLVGINLLREGLDLTEVSLVAILDADKEGFLRSETSLIQTIGRAARNAEGKVIMYADTVTDSMEKAVTETNRRREIQMKYNEEHGITPKTIVKDVRAVLEISSGKDKGKKRK